LDKQKGLNNRINKISIYFLLSVLAFYSLPFTANAAVQLGPITLSNAKLIYIFIPLFFSYISLEFAIVTNHKGETMKVLKILSLYLYKQKVDYEYFENPLRLNFFTRLILPLSFWTEFYNALDKKVGCMAAFLLIPALPIICLPFYFQFICIRFLVANYWDGWLTKVSLIFSIWLFVLTLYFYFKTMSQPNWFKKRDGVD
jgi:hypothetical protein